MTRTSKRSGDAILSRIFFRLMPVQILILAMPSINAIVDGAIASRYIGAHAVSVIGLYTPLMLTFLAIGAMLLSGSQVLCGRYLGSGQIERTRGVFSLNITVSLLVGAAVTFLCAVFPAFLADLLGADEAHREGLITYACWISIGLIPQILAQQLTMFLQLERQNTRSYLGVTAMILCNVLLDILFVTVWNMDLMGLALATAVSNWAFLLILGLHYFTGKAQLKFARTEIRWRELPRIIRIGISGALLIFFVAMRNLVLNRTLLTWSGSDGLAAVSAFNLLCGLIVSTVQGAAATTRVMASISVGEEDRASLIQVMRIALTKGMLLIVGEMALLLALAAPLTSLFFPDPGAEVHRLLYQLLWIYTLCLPLILFTNVVPGYYQALGRILPVNLQSFLDGFLFMAGPAVLLAPVLGALGVWLANPIGLVLTVLIAPIYVLCYWKRWPRSIDEWLTIPAEFGVGPADRLEITIRSMEDVIQTSLRVSEFCCAHGIDEKRSYYSALCLEEMAGNVVAHGFHKDRKSHTVDVRVICKDGSIILRVKDDCIPFDPKERLEMVTPDDPAKNIGIRMVYRIAGDVTYQNLLGLNVLTIRL